MYLVQLLLVAATVFGVVSAEDLKPPTTINCKGSGWCGGKAFSKGERLPLDDVRIKGV